jgi:hypothetical protein
VLNCREASRLTSKAPERRLPLPAAHAIAPAPDDVPPLPQLLHAHGGFSDLSLRVNPWHAGLVPAALVSDTMPRFPSSRAQREV